MATRLYVLPLITTTTPKGDRRDPKYLDTHLAGVEWSLMDMGDEPICLVAADVGAEHAAFAAETDVLALPANLDQPLGAQLATVQNALEARNIPAGWVQSTHTYRQVVRVVAQAFQFLQRLQVVRPGRLFGGGVTLDTRFNQLPAAVRSALTAAATDLGYDTSGLTGTSTLRTILKTMADQWRQIELFIGGEAF